MTNMVIRMNPFQDDRPRISLQTIERYEQETGLDATFLFNEGYAVLIVDPIKLRHKLEKYPKSEIVSEALDTTMLQEGGA